MEENGRARPVQEMLARASGRLSGHMPGHKGKAPFEPADLYALDTTELPTTDDLYAPERGLWEAQRLYAKAAGAGGTLFLHNGSTAGVHTLLQLYACEDETVLLPRNAHLSAINGCILGGLRPVWLPVRQTVDGYHYLAEADALDALDAHPDARAILMTRPDYFGGCMPMARVVKKAQERGIRVVVDEAHGAHLPWMPEPLSAGALGADAWVQSVHKTLPGLTGSAVLHLRDEADASRALRILRREQTSSPSFLLMRSIDDARVWMEERGAEALTEVVKAVRELRSALPAMGYADARDAWTDTGYDFDPTRLVVDAPQGGYALADALREQGVDVEMADERRVVLIFTAMDDPADIRRIGELLRTVPPEPLRCLPPPERPALPRQLMPPRRAAMGPTEQVPLERAAGRVSAVAAGLYPPGIPLVCPGEEITEEIIDRLRAAEPQRRFGMEGDFVTCTTTSALSLTWTVP